MNKFKIGDKVRVKSLNWYIINRDSNGNVEVLYTFTPKMSEYCGKIATISSDVNNVYKLDIDNGEWLWSEEMFEDSIVGPLELIDRTKLPLNIGDRVLINGKIKGTIVGYYFSEKLNDYEDSYGYTVDRDDFAGSSKGHDGYRCSYDAFGNKIKHGENKSCWYFGLSSNKFKLIKEENNIMEKKDLKSGMVVERRDGVRLLVVDMNGDIVLLGNNNFHSGLSAFHSDMTNMITREYDIMKVYKVFPSNLDEMFDDSNILETLYERKEQIELTMQEIADKFGIDINNLKIKK